MRLYLDRSQDLASFVDRDENEASLVKYRWPDQQAVYSYNEDCTLDKEDKVTWSKAANSGTALIIIVSLAFLFDILSRSIKSKD
jgi:hypothetical protein